MVLSKIRDSVDDIARVFPTFPEALFINPEIGDHDIDKESEFDANQFASFIAFYMDKPFSSPSRAWNDFAVVNNKNIPVKSDDDAEVLIPFINPATKRTTLDKATSPAFHDTPDVTHLDYKYTASSKHHLRDVSIDGWIDDDRKPARGKYFQFLRDESVDDHDAIDPDFLLSLPDMEYDKDQKEVIHEKILDNKITGFMKQERKLVAKNVRSSDIRDLSTREFTQDKIKSSMDSLHYDMLSFIDSSGYSPLFRKMLDAGNEKVFNKALHKTIVGTLVESTKENKPFEYLDGELKKIVDDNKKRVSAWKRMKQSGVILHDVEKNSDRIVGSMVAGIILQHELDKKSIIAAAKDEEKYYAKIGREAIDIFRFTIP